MRILVTGAAGMLAADVIPALLRQKHEVIRTDINRRIPEIRKLDVTKADDVLRTIGDVKPDYVFHLAAETNVDLCQKDPDHAYKVNTEGTKNIVRACKEFGAKLLYVSTAAVFDGKKEKPYTELDEPKPLSEYGKSKLRGEIIVWGGELLECFIIRAGWMVGGWELDKKFVYKIIQQLKSGKKELMAVNDKFGSPTFTKDFAANLMNVINTEKYDLYHMVNKGTCSRYDMAVKIVEFMELEGKVRIEPVSSEKFPLPAPRGRSEMLVNQKLSYMKLDNMPYWEESLEDYIRANRDKVEVVK